MMNNDSFDWFCESSQLPPEYGGNTTRDLTQIVQKYIQKRHIPLIPLNLVSHKSESQAVSPKAASDNAENSPRNLSPPSSIKLNTSPGRVRTTHSESNMQKKLYTC